MFRYVLNFKPLILKRYMKTPQLNLTRKCCQRRKKESLVAGAVPFATEFHKFISSIIFDLEIKTGSFYINNFAQRMQTIFTFKVMYKSKGG